jgi:hypothetical protein
VPRQTLDAPENLPKEVARQVVLGQLRMKYRAYRIKRPPVLKSR